LLDLASTQLAGQCVARDGKQPFAAVAGIAVAALFVWWLTGTGAFKPDAGGSRADLPFEFWLLAVAAGAFLGGVVVVALRRR
jgi:hypothetical protein